MNANINQQHMFSNKMIRALLVPIILEQLLNSIMGTADTMMVSNVGSAAISAVSLVDSINILVIQAFSALAAGGAIVCAQYIGQGNKERANESARQVLFIITLISVAVSAFCLIFQKPLLHLIFGAVEADVMRASEIYFFYTALSFPFIAAYDAAASIFRAQENTRDPMLISMVSNVMNIVGNAIMIWGFHMGVAGAALATLISRIFCAVVVLAELRLDRQPIVVRDYLKIRPDWRMIRRIPWNRNSIRCGEQYVPVRKAGDSVHSINTWNNSNRCAGNDEHSGESERNRWYRSRNRIDDNCRSMSGS